MHQLGATAALGACGRGRSDSALPGANFSGVEPTLSPPPRSAPEVFKGQILKRNRSVRNSECRRHRRANCTHGKVYAREKVYATECCQSFLLSSLRI